MYTLNLKHHFDAAHHLLNYKGKCANLHGHRWVVEIEIKTKKLLNDMVVDFKDLKKIIDKLDHKYLNEELDFNPTAELMAQKIFENLSKILQVKSIKLWETSTSYAEVINENL